MNKHNRGGITNKGMEDLADSLEDFLDLYEEVYIIPEDYAGEEEKINRAIKISRKLIKKLRDHDDSIFDFDDINENDLI